MASPLIGEIRDLAGRAGNPKTFELWRRQVRHAGYCQRPVRLSGVVEEADTQTGAVRVVLDTAVEPDGVLLTACGTRRAVRCGPCAERYRADAFQLIRAGLAGGKGVPATVADHPRLLATFTAPSFGAVHSRRERHGRAGRCRPARQGARCAHGRPERCGQRHEAGDRLLGQPLCGDCYDYQAAVIWNALAPELWRRTTVAVRRELARQGGLTVAEYNRQVRVSYVKVAEFQARGAVHYHAIIRLDGAGEGAEVSAPPSWATADMLARAVRQAARRVRLRAPSGLEVRWGSQCDVREVPADGWAGGPAAGPGATAAYLAKYATKAAEGLAGTVLDRPVRNLPDLKRRQRGLSEHAARLLACCWKLGADPALAKLRLRRWAHQLGYGGHFTTRSRRYSTTMGALRQARRHHARQHATRAAGRPLDVGTTITAATMDYAGVGYRTIADAMLAASMASVWQDMRQIAREELMAVG